MAFPLRKFLNRNPDNKSQCTGETLRYALPPSHRYAGLCMGALSEALNRRAQLADHAQLRMRAHCTFMDTSLEGLSVR